MLKIKDCVDLKDLENFGFKYNDNIGKYVYRVINQPLCINVWNRKIDIDEYSTLINNILADLIYKLTEANIVEEIEDDRSLYYEVEEDSDES